MEISLLTLQGSFLLLQLSAPQLLFQIPIQAQVHEKILPVPPLSHCYNSQMHFMSLPMALHFTTFCKLCYSNSSAMKEDCCVSICYSVVCTYTIQREVKLHSCPGYKTRFYFCWSRDMFYSSLQRTTQSLTLEKRCSTQQLLLLKEYKHSENQQTIKLHTSTKPVLEWNLLLLYLNATQLP